MNILELAEEIGLHPKRTAATHGGEYHSPCPECGGDDRFCLWPKEGTDGRYWCRQCDKSGDAIQFCRDFMGLSFQESCDKLRIERSANYRLRYQPKPVFSPRVSIPPKEQWKLQAFRFLQKCMGLDTGLGLLKSTLIERGLSAETALQFKLAYNPRTIWAPRKDWGLDEQYNDNGRLKTVWLPRGPVIPTFLPGEQLPCRLKIRRDEWQPEDDYPKYVEITGSQSQYSIYGDTNLPLILVEAEFDAILLQQEAADLCCSIALNGAGKKPDTSVDQILKSAAVILFSLDFDEAGKREFAFWKKTYPKIIPWPTPVGKSPSEAFLQGVDLREWLLSKINPSRIEY